MPPRNKQRLHRVEQAIGALPVRRDLLDKAYQHFKETGKLPEEQQLAWAVCERSLGSEARRRAPGPIELRIMRSGNPDWVPPEPEPRSLRYHVFYETVYGPEIVRDAARLVLQMCVQHGDDVTDPGFLADVPRPKHSGVGLYVLGFPDCFAMRPYVAQAKRLFVRFDVLREQINHDDPRRGSPFETAAKLFNATGDLPEDQWCRDMVLASTELNALIRHAGGDDVGPLMAALDAAARFSGAQREAAIARVQDLARSGAVVSKDAGVGASLERGRVGRGWFGKLQRAVAGSKRLAGRDR